MAAEWGGRQEKGAEEVEEEDEEVVEMGCG